jgi:hypothetical protein
MRPVLHAVVSFCGYLIEYWGRRPKGIRTLNFFMFLAFRPEPFDSQYTQNSMQKSKRAKPVP